MHSSDSLNISSFKFGIELEANVNLDVFAEHAEGGWQAHWEHCGAEIKSPPLCGYSGLLEVRRKIRALWKHNKSFTFKDCGLHVHVDIQDFRLIHLKRLVILAKHLDDVMFAMMDGTRFDNEYCRRMAIKPLHKIKSAKTLKDLMLLADGRERYDALNLFAFPKHGTVEFRYCHGTLDWRIIYSLISFYLRLVALSRSQKDINDPSLSDMVNVFLPPRVLMMYPDLGVGSTTFESLKGPSYKLQKVLDLIEMKGPPRLVLEEMFMANAGDFKQSKNKKELEEVFPNISFRMKG